MDDPDLCLTFFVKIVIRVPLWLCDLVAKRLLLA